MNAVRPLLIVVLLLGCTPTESPRAADEASPGERPPIETEVPETPSEQPVAEPDRPVTPAPVARPVEPPLDPVHGHMDGGTPVDLLPSNAAAFVRERRRMDLAQLGAAIKAATGGVSWTDSKGNDQLQSLASTLGVADYLQRLEADLGAGPVFQKFLGDAARSVCTVRIDQELAQDPAERTLMALVDPEDTLESAPDAVEKNLANLLLRFHGVKVASPDDAALQRWRWLFESVSHVTKKPAQGWRAVCIALISHPDFYSY